MKETISFTGCKENGNEREVIVEYEEVEPNCGVVDFYWAPLYESQPKKERFLFGCDYQGNFEDIIDRMKEIWPKARVIQDNEQLTETNHN